jgi:AcrR family transcriptional regulator
VAGGQPQRWSGWGSEESIQDSQRERLLAAIARAAAEQGYSKLTVEQVVHYAGVSSDTFYEHFSSKEQGLIAAQDAFLDRLWVEVIGVCDSGEEWPVRVRSALDAILSHLAEASTVARMFAVEAAAASLAVTERQFTVLETFAGLLRDGRKIYPRAASLPVVTERALVGGVASMISARLLGEEPQVLVSLGSELVELILTPYVGHTEAKRVATA